MGNISQSMLKHLDPKPWYETAAVVDVRPDALERARTSLGLPQEQLYTGLEEALISSDADTVIINTPSELHFQQATAALNAGRHVLVAKPITNSFEDAAELVELAARQGVTLSVGQQMRYRRHYRAVARFIASGQLGSVEAMNFLNTKPRHQALNLKGMAQPALFEMSCHHFDSILALVPDRMPEQITCDGFQPSWSVYDGPCMVNALIRFSGNLHLLYQGGFSSQADNYELRIEGSQGALRCRGIHMSNDTMTYEFATPGQAFQNIVIDDDIPGGDPWGQFFDIWHDYVEGGEEPPFSGRNNLAVFAMLSAGIDSIAAGSPAAIPIAANPRYATAFPSFSIP
jgi:predicted dehydrogenase